VSTATVVRYTSRPEAANENERLISEVFAELAGVEPEGMFYVAIRLDDGVSFVHIALFEGDDNPLPALAAFGKFASGIHARCAVGPSPVNGTVIGSYGN
jgi:hypothetical protein